MRLGRFACIAAMAASALQPPARPQQPTFRTEASLVRVDVTVIDHDGEPVTNLTADDFELKEDGIRQTVRSFGFVSANGQPPPGDEDLSLRISSPEQAAAEAARDDVRVFLIFWDEYHINDGGHQTRNVLMDFVKSALGPTDLVALMDPFLPVDAMRFTRDRDELAARIQKLSGHAGYRRAQSMEEVRLQRREQPWWRAQVTLSAMKAAAVHLGTLKAGRKAIIFVSGGISTDLENDERTLLKEVTRAANDNNVAIYGLSPSPVAWSMPNILQMFAASTGGQTFASTIKPPATLRQVVKDASAFYLLGYSSTRDPKDGRFHSIDVRVKRSGVDVRARKGYWAQTLAEIEQARADAAAATAVPPDVSSALAALSSVRAERMLDVWAGIAVGTDRQPQVTVAWTPRAPSNPKVDQGRTVSIIASDAGGEREFKTSFAAGRFSFASPPGELHLHLIVRDATDDTLDEHERAMTVPDFSSASLALSSPVVIRARTPVEAKTMASVLDAVPFAGREFTRADRVFVRFAVYGESAARAIASAHLMNRRGAPLLDLPVTALADTIGSGTTYQVDLPLAATAVRSDFLVAVEAARGEERARLLVPLRIVP